MYGNSTSVLGVGAAALPMTGAGQLMAPFLIGTLLVMVGSLLLLRHWMLSMRDADLR